MKSRGKGPGARSAGRDEGSRSSRRGRRVAVLVYCREGQRGRIELDLGRRQGRRQESVFLLQISSPASQIKAESARAPHALLVQSRAYRHVPLGHSAGTAGRRPRFGVSGGHFLGFSLRRCAVVYSEPQSILLCPLAAVPARRRIGKTCAALFGLVGSSRNDAVRPCTDWEGATNGRNRLRAARCRVRCTALGRSRRVEPSCTKSTS